MPYTSDDIHVVTWIDAVRRRPAMYVGDTSHLGLHWLIRELLDVPLNPTRMSITLRVDAVNIAALSVAPSVQPSTKSGPSFLVQACTSLMTALDDPPTIAGAEILDNSTSPATFVRQGAAPPCLAIANALSAEFVVASNCQGACSRITFRGGLVALPLAATTTTASDGLEITFTPDREIFKAVTLRFDLLAHVARDASLVRRVPIELREESSGVTFAVTGDAG